MRLMKATAKSKLAPSNGNPDRPRVSGNIARKAGVFRPSL
jgi:hypothetical protein